MTTGPSIIAINVGNARTQIGRYEEGTLCESSRCSNDQIAEIVQKIVQSWKPISETDQAAIALASVNDPVAARLISAVEDQLGVEIYRVGEDLPIPVSLQLDPETLTGADRLLNAAAAFDAAKQACVIVDAGTAITVDFVDGEGTFHGGAIVPGAAMQLQAMHEHTDALPEIEFQVPDKEPFGRSTTQAMLQGVFHGIRGMVWKLIERYAEAYGAYPMVIATGGDSELLFGDDDLVDRCVPDLTLAGIYVAVRHALSADEAGLGRPEAGADEPRARQGDNGDS